MRYLTIYVYFKLPIYLAISNKIRKNTYVLLLIHSANHLFSSKFPYGKLGVKVRNMKMDFNTGGTWLSRYQAINNNGM